MVNTVDYNKLFKAPQSKAETKADITDRNARALIDAENRLRNAKTEKLRQARLEKEAAEAVDPAIPVKNATAKGKRKQKPKSAADGVDLHVGIAR